MYKLYNSIIENSISVHKSIFINLPFLKCKHKYGSKVVNVFVNRQLKHKFFAGYISMEAMCDGIGL